MSEPRIAQASAGDLDDVRALMRDYAASVDAPQCFADFEAELNNLPGPCAPPRGGILIARAAGKPAGVVAFQPLASGAAEMKRLYVRPEFRGQGLGKRLAEAALAAARAAGHGTLCLSTLPAAMPVADAMYRAMGFRAAAPHAGAACSATCYARALD